MKLTAVKYNDILHVDQAFAGDIATIRNGTGVTVEVKRARNINHHRLYWALVGKVHENLDHNRYPSTDFLSDAIKVSVGHCTPFEMADGSIALIPKSISFAEMDQDQFAKFFDSVCRVVCERIIPGMDAGALKNEISQMVGIPVTEMG